MALKHLTDCGACGTGWMRDPGRVLRNRAALQPVLPPPGLPSSDSAAATAMQAPMPGAGRLSCGYLLVIVMSLATTNRTGPAPLDAMHSPTAGTITATPARPSSSTPPQLSTAISGMPPHPTPRHLPNSNIHVDLPRPPPLLLQPHVSMAGATLSPTTPPHHLIILPISVMTY